MHLRLQRLDSLRSVSAQEWNVLAGDSPFLKHEFLMALERSGCIGGDTAWQPAYLVARYANGALAGALPLYVKYDSLGEFVFDWGWADAYERSGRPYYPKLVTSVPFTPATGERLLVAPGADRAAVTEHLIRGARDLAAELDASSWHVLFPTDAERQLLEREGLLVRKSCQFHWHNQGYGNFDDFLAKFSSEKRKKARRERRRIAEAGITFEHLKGDEPTADDWDAIYAFYSRTFLRRGHAPYLNRALFAEVAATMPDDLVIVLARFNGAPIAVAICFRSGTTLYGRYWGSAAEFHSLHFETCYYQGIEYCIRHGLTTFEPGTQGEHKVARGFSPTACWSCHWLADARFRRAVQAFLARETVQVDAYMDYVDEHVPYRRETEPTPAR